MPPKEELKLILTVLFAAANVASGQATSSVPEQVVDRAEKLADEVLRQFDSLFEKRRV